MDKSTESKGRGGREMVCAELKMVIQPSRLDEAAEIIRLITEPTRVRKGCLSFNAYRDIENDNVYMILETWETVEDLLAHIRSDTYKNMIALMDLLSESPEVRFNVVTKTDGVGFLRDALGGDKS